MTEGETDFGLPDPLDDGDLGDPGMLDDHGLVADVPEAGAHGALDAGELAATEPTSQDEALEALCALGGPLELAADPVADAELERWLADPGPQASPAELADLDRRLRAGLSQK